MQSTSPKRSAAFLGLGLMGTGMARRLLADGFPLTVWNRTREKAEALAAGGARVAATPREAARGAELIFSMVADDPASRSVWLGENGVLAGASPGSLCIESSTVSPVWIKELAAPVTAHGCEFLDAPVTGSKVQAQAGELNFLVGGSRENVERARPAFAAMGRAIVHVGPTGSGAVLKLINNFLCGVQAASLAEAVAWIERSNLDCKQALEFLEAGAPGSPMIKTLSRRMSARDYTPNFLLRLAAKDLSYAVSEAKCGSLDLTMAEAAFQLASSAIQSGLGEEDVAAVVEHLRKGGSRATEH